MDKEKVVLLYTRLTMYVQGRTDRLWALGPVAQTLTPIGYWLLVIYTHHDIISFHIFKKFLSFFLYLFIRSTI